MTSPPFPYTLAELGSQLDTFARRQLGFAETVQNLAVVRAQMKVIKDHRKDIHSLIKAHHAKGEQTKVPGLVLRPSKPAAPRAVRSVPSTVIKKVNPKLWAASRVAKPRVSVAPPKTIVSTIHDDAVRAVGQLPHVDDQTGLDAAVIAYQSMPSTGTLAEYEEKYIEHLKLCAAIGKWDGLPIAFRDGWTFGLSALLYDSDRLREIAPELWERLATESTTGGNSRLIVGKIGADDRDSDDDAE